jgi:hypothetical protein
MSSMGQVLRLLIVAILALTPAISFGEPTEDVSSVINHWAEAFNSNDVDSLVGLLEGEPIDPRLHDGVAIIGAEPERCVPQTTSHPCILHAWWVRIVRCTYCGFLIDRDVGTNARGAFALKIGRGASRAPLSLVALGVEFFDAEWSCGGK